jgi:hypothetical protein
MQMGGCVFDKINQVTIALQGTDIGIRESRYMLDELCKEIPALERKLSVTAEIVHSDFRPFEVAICKVLGKKENELTQAEKKTLKNFTKVRFNAEIVLLTISGKFN